MSEMETENRRLKRHQQDEMRVAAMHKEELKKKDSSIQNLEKQLFEIKKETQKFSEQEKQLKLQAKVAAKNYEAEILKLRQELKRSKRAAAIRTEDLQTDIAEIEDREYGFRTKCKRMKLSLTAEQEKSKSYEEKWKLLTEKKKTLVEENALLKTKCTIVQNTVQLLKEQLAHSRSRRDE